MGDVMTFPASVEEFMEQYKMTDTERVYSNGVEYVPIYRMKQWFEHCRNQQLLTIDAVPVVRCKDCKYYRYGKHFTDIKFCQRLPYYAAEGGLDTADDDFCSYGERKEGGK